MIKIGKIISKVILLSLLLISITACSNMRNISTKNGEEITYSEDGKVLEEAFYVDDIKLIRVRDGVEENEVIFESVDRSILVRTHNVIEGSNEAKKLPSVEELNERVANGDKMLERLEEGKYLFSNTYFRGYIDFYMLYISKDGKSIHEGLDINLDKRLENQEKIKKQLLKNYDYFHSLLDVKNEN